MTPDTRRDGPVDRRDRLTQREFAAEYLRPL